MGTHVYEKIVNDLQDCEPFFILVTSQSKQYNYGKEKRNIDAQTPNDW